MTGRTGVGRGRDNVAWKAPLAGAGISTPIVSGDRVFVTSQLGAGISRQGPRLVQGGDAAAMGEKALGGAKGADPSKTTFIVEAFSRSTGARVWERRIEAQSRGPRGSACEPSRTS